MPQSAKCTNEEFINIWNTSKSINEVARKLAQDRSDVRRRAWKLGIYQYPKALTIAIPANKDEEFIVAWQTLKSVMEVAQKCELGYNQTSSKAARFKKLGILLKNMGKSQKSYDIERLKLVATNSVSLNKLSNRNNAFVLTVAVRSAIASIGSDQFTREKIGNIIKNSYPLQEIKVGDVASHLWVLEKKGLIQCIQRGKGKYPSIYANVKITANCQ